MHEEPLARPAQPACGDDLAGSAAAGFAFEGRPEEVCEREAGAAMLGTVARTSWDALVAACPAHAALAVRLCLDPAQDAQPYEALRDAYQRLTEAAFRQRRPLLDVRVQVAPLPREIARPGGATSPDARAYAGLCFPSIAVGGTFDHLHAGHKLLLSAAAMRATRRVLVGVTDDAMLAAKQFAQQLQPWPARVAAVRAFLAWFAPGLAVDIVPLVDHHGPTTRRGEAIDALAVSPETLSGALEINRMRGATGLAPLHILAVDLIDMTPRCLPSPRAAPTVCDAPAAAAKASAADADRLLPVPGTDLAATPATPPPPITPKLSSTILRSILDGRAGERPL